MGQFKPMVKMMTTEPSVILKLKKGGKVASKMDGGYMPMQTTMPAQAMPARGGLAPAASPMKPSMAARRRAMMAKPSMSPTLMKKGGVTAAEVEKELKQHEGLPMKKAHKKATGGVVNGQGGFANGGIIKSTKGETKMVTAKVDRSPAKTGDVKLGNGGGYKMGGSIDNDKCWENAPANTAKAGKSGGTTGGVRKGNAGGYKMGGQASKKAYATGGTVDTGKPVAMPKKPVSRPVANSLQSGTFKKGGMVGGYSDGNLVDASKGAYDKAIGPSEGEMDMAKAIRSVPRKLYEGAKSMMGLGTSASKPPAGSVTKTEKSITVAPGKKRGGSAC